MLVLSRKERERVWIGESILLTVVEVRSGQVRLAFEAPEGVCIDREEVRRRRREFRSRPPRICADRAGKGPA
jgi:carbon storage regulator